LLTHALAGLPAPSTFRPLRARLGSSCQYTAAHVAPKAAAAKAARHSKFVCATANKLTNTWQAAVKQFSDAVKEAQRSLGRTLTKAEQRTLHGAISGENYGCHDIVAEAMALFGKR